MKTHPIESSMTNSGLAGQMSLNPQIGVERGRFPPRIAQIEFDSEWYFGSKGT
jgi:hypothetical protein